MKHLSKVMLLLCTLSIFIGLSLAQDDVTITENLRNLVDADEAQFTILLDLLKATDLNVRRWQN